MQKPLKKLQLGVIGSTADLNYGPDLEEQAEKLGYWIAKNNAILIFGAEKDYDSLSAAACRGAKRGGGLTVGVTYGKGITVYEKNADIIIASGLERGGGRELPLILSCDAVIAINGGSGTLNEITIAYQANIPIVALAKTGGWSEQLADKFLDARKRVRIESATTSKEAVKKAIALARRTLFVAATHGNEKIGVQILQQIEQTGLISETDWLIGNPRAFQNKTRYVETDLNRVFPGNPQGSTYEERRAAEILRKTQGYRYVVDLHGTDDDTGIFIIVSNPTPANLALAKAFEIPNIVLWTSVNGRSTGPLNQFVPCGVELEAGPQRSVKVVQKLKQVLKNYLRGSTPTQAQQYFQVYGKLEDRAVPQKLKSFVPAKIARESFYPLLVDRYPGVKCYKMKTIAPPR